MKAFLLPDDHAFLRYVEVPGDGPPIVWVHGWACSSTAELMPVAVQAPLHGRRSLLVDLLGHGYSDKPDGFGYTVEDHARTVLALVEGLGLTQYALVGHSMGGAVVVHVAAARPERVELLVLAEPWVDAHGEEVFDGQSEDAFAEAGFAEWIGGQAKAAGDDPSGLAAKHVGISRSVYSRALYREDCSMRDGTTPTVRSLLSGFEMPRMCLQGQQSDPEPEFEREIQELGFDWHLIPDAAHAIGLFNPLAFAESVSAGLNR